jgi:hypothetical protein
VLRNTFLLNKSKLFNRFYAVVRSLTFHVNCGFYLVRIFAINLIVFLHSFCFFFIYQVIVLYVCVCVLLHSGVHLATGPAPVNLHVSNLNSMEQYIQEQFVSLNKYFSNNYIFTAVL